MIIGNNIHRDMRQYQSIKERNVERNVERNQVIKLRTRGTREESEKLKPR
jgi:hypothetical protein